MSDVDQYNFIENNIRGGTSYISERYVESGICKDDPNYKIMQVYIDGKIKELYYKTCTH